MEYTVRYNYSVFLMSKKFKFENYFEIWKMPSQLMADSQNFGGHEFLWGKNHSISLNDFHDGLNVVSILSRVRIGKKRIGK